MNKPSMHSYISKNPLKTNTYTKKIGWNKLWKTVEKFGLIVAIVGGIGALIFSGISLNQNKNSQRANSVRDSVTIAQNTINIIRDSIYHSETKSLFEKYNQQADTLIKNTKELNEFNERLLNRQLELERPRLIISGSSTEQTIDSIVKVRFNQYKILKIDNRIRNIGKRSAFSVEINSTYLFPHRKSYFIIKSSGVNPLSEGHTLNWSNYVNFPIKNNKSILFMKMVATWYDKELKKSDSIEYYMKFDIRNIKKGGGNMNKNELEDFQSLMKTARNNNNYSDDFTKMNKKLYDIYVE